MFADGDGFTRREREVAGLAAAGLTNAEIARRLGVTRNAIRFHLKEIHTKLHTGGDRDVLRQRFLPAPSLTIMLDIAPQTAVTRKSADRDRYERDLALQLRVRESYHRLAARSGAVLLDGERAKDAVAADVFTHVVSRLALP